MTGRKLPPAEVFAKALEAHAGRFGVRLGAEDLALLSAYFEMVMSWNPRLHLVAPCGPAEFATRHVLESLAALPFLAGGVRVVDVGSGAGLPVIPCLIVRPDLDATLVEASPKKSVFLREALRKVGRPARVVAERFEKTPPPRAAALTCRALERFGEMLPKLVEWSALVPALLLFGGESLRGRLEEAALPFDAVKMPESEKRFLFVVRRG